MAESDSDSSDSDIRELRNAIRDREAGIENAGTSRLSSTQVLFTSAEMRQEFIRDLESGGEPGRMVRAVLDMVDNEDIMEIQVARPRGSSRDPRRMATGPSPPPSYSEAMATDPRDDPAPAPEASSSDTSASVCARAATPRFQTHTRPTC